MKADVENVLNGRPPAATTLLPTSMIDAASASSFTAVHQGHDDSADRHEVEMVAVARPRARHLIASMTALLLVVAGASAFGIYKSDRPQAAAVTTKEVPAVLGLGPVGIESLLRNADLVPRFEYVHGADGTSLDTAIRQSPEGGEIATVDSTVTVVINIGPLREAVPASLVYRDVDFRPWTSQPSVARQGQSSLDTGSDRADRRQERLSDGSHQTKTGGSDQGKGEEIKKSGKGKKGK